MTHYIWVSFTVRQYWTTFIYVTCAIVFEMAHKGVLMNIDMNEPAKPYSNDEARHYFREIILGIEYCTLLISSFIKVEQLALMMLLLVHNNEIVHRDIKPDNLLLSNDDVLKIVDFGVSEMFHKGDDGMLKSAGSPAFNAPELCAAHHGKVSGKAADIWSMGITLYCLIYGKPPFMSHNLIELMDQIRSEP